MNLFATTPSSRLLSLGLLVLRLALGAVFLVHGGQKLFQLGFAGTTQMLAQMNIPGASIVGPALAIIEPLAGLGVTVGLLTRLAGLAIAIDMLGAILTFHLPNGFLVPRGIEFVMMNCAAGLALALIGAGQFSVDHAIADRGTRR